MGGRLAERHRPLCGTDDRQAQDRPLAGTLRRHHASASDSARHAATRHPGIHRAQRGQAKDRAEKLDAKELATNYNLLQVWDIISLYICSTEVLKPDHIEPAPIAYSGAAGTGMTLTPVEARTIALDPYPFDQPSLTTNMISGGSQNKFKDSAELQSVYFRTAPQVASFRLVPSGAMHWTLHAIGHEQFVHRREAKRSCLARGRSG